jgi:phage terminase small subunit
MNKDTDDLQRGKPLTDKQERFCEEYLVDLNATQAAIRAGYSPKTARRIGSLNTTKVDISARIAHNMAERSKRTCLTQDMVVDHLRCIAFARLHEYYELVPGLKRSTVRLKPLDQLTLDQRVAIKTITNTRHGLMVELYDKADALELLGKHLNIFDKHQKAGASTFNIVDYSKAETPGYDEHGQPTHKPG